MVRVARAARWFRCSNAYCKRKTSDSPSFWVFIALVVWLISTPELAELAGRWLPDVTGR